MSGLLLFRCLWGIPTMYVVISFPSHVEQEKMNLTWYGQLLVNLEILSFLLTYLPTFLLLLILLLLLLRKAMAMLSLTLKTKSKKKHFWKCIICFRNRFFVSKSGSKKDSKKISWNFEIVERMIKKRFRERQQMPFSKALKTLRLGNGLDNG